MTREKRVPAPPFVLDAARDEPVRFTIEMGHVAHDLLPGHRVRITISSSLYPLYARDPAIGDYLHGSTTRLASQRVFHDLTRPSRIMLPVRPSVASADGVDG